MPDQDRLSYRDRLLITLGMSREGETNQFWRNDEEIPGLNRYGDQTLGKPPSVSPEDAAQYKEVPISDEEFQEWCKAWRGSLIVHVLGKRV